MKETEIVDEFLLKCSCGDGILQVSQWKDDGTAFINYFIPAFYAAQGEYGGWRNALKIIWNILRGKEHCLYEIVIEDNETLNRFKKFVESMREIDGRKDM